MWSNQVSLGFWLFYSSLFWGSRIRCLLVDALVLVSCIGFMLFVAPRSETLLAVGLGM